MVFQPSGSKSFKNQRIFNGFGVRPVPRPGLWLDRGQQPMGRDQQPLRGQAGPDRTPRPGPPGSPGQPKPPKPQGGSNHDTWLTQLGVWQRVAIALGGRAPTAHQRSRSNKHPTHMVMDTYTDKQTQMNGPSQGPECWERRWGNIQ